MQPKHMIRSINHYPMDEHDPKRNQHKMLSCEIYVRNPEHLDEWLCIASFFDMNTLLQYKPPSGAFAIYFGDNWIEVKPLVCVECGVNEPMSGSWRICSDCWNDDPT